MMIQLLRLDLPRSPALLAGVVLVAWAHLAHAQQGAPASQQERDAQTLQRAEQRCSSGDADLCLTLGNLYKMGQWPSAAPGAAPDHARAASAYQRACDAGNAKGCAKLGDLMAVGQGVARDIPRAIFLLESACQRREGTGCFGLALIYQSDAYVHGDPVLTIYFAEKACNLGVAQGCKLAVFRYLNGSMGVAAMDPAVGPAKKGCELSEVDSCTALGQAFAQGAGVPQDLQQSRQYFQRACQFGCKECCQKLAQ